MQHAEKRRRLNCGWASPIRTLAEKLFAAEDPVPQIELKDDALLHKIKEDMLRIETVLTSESLENWNRYM